MLHTTFQLRGYCSRAGYDKMDGVLRELCFLYNAALQERRDAYKKCGKTVRLYDQYKSLTTVRHDDPDGLGSFHVSVTRGPIDRLERAFNAFFRRVKTGDKPGFPRFQPASRFKCLNVLEPRPGWIQSKGHTVLIKIKGLPPLKLRPSRPLPDRKNIKSLRIVRRPTGCTVDMVYAVEKAALPESKAAIGIDLGVRKRCTLSNGETVQPFTRDEAQQKVLQQRLARCRKGSNTRKKAVQQYARFRRREAVRNRNACHRITTDLVTRFGLIVLEALTLRGMMRSAKGTVERPGHNVKQKAGLNRSIQEQTWGLLREQLTYKAAWAGRQLVLVDPKYTSQECSQCSHRHAPGSSEVYRCPACGLSLDRDVNAAKNILRAGNVARVGRQKDILCDQSI